jgi:hypothetical protein
MLPHVATVLLVFQRFPKSPGNSMQHECDMKGRSFAAGVGQNSGEQTSGAASLDLYKKTQIVPAQSASSKVASIEKMTPEKQRQIITKSCRGFAVALKS